MIFILKAATSLVQESSTWDETHYFGLGKYLLTHGRWDVPGSILHPPLSFYLHSIPLMFVATDPTVWRTDPSGTNSVEYRGKADVPRGQALLSAPENRNNRLLNFARMMMVLTGALLAWFVYRWSSELYGSLAGLTATILCCFCPNILANSRLITPDIALTTFSFISLYVFFGKSRALDGCATRLLAESFSASLSFQNSRRSCCFRSLPLLSLPHGCLTRTANLRGYLIFGAVGLFILAAGYGMNLEPFFAGIGYQFAHSQAGQPTFLFENTPRRDGGITSHSPF